MSINQYTTFTPETIKNLRKYFNKKYPNSLFLCYAILNGKVPNLHCTLLHEKNEESFLLNKKEIKDILSPNSVKFIKD